ncbi:hypothetical protein PIB30_084098 [Stylosanthes scabra]|uniref:Uncharacterized protein n=1 Tax=Stylosanthes scabra TaxID=79078 RepID=A0ABU6VUG8_9FABA|nr:hypothetical protein [Stylosanthes scabra]
MDNPNRRLTLEELNSPWLYIQDDFAKASSFSPISRIQKQPCARNQPSPSIQPPLEDTLRIFIDEQRGFQRQQTTQLATITELLTLLTTQISTHLLPTSHSSNTNGSEIITVEIGKGVKAEASLEFKEPKGLSIVEEMVTTGGVKDEAKKEWVVSVPFPQVEGKHSQIQSGKLPQVNPFIKPIIYEEKGQDPMNKIDECLHQKIKESHWMWDKRKKRSKGIMK